ncbi:MAG TPA: carbamoyltransferase [Bryobacteraceae bacterium]|jgi:carbamoyltransferase|nr:carbamoyltransferase [Bryobacteraceae bacterium]
MRVLGISAFYHDSAAALVRDGQIVAAAQEERFSRRKHDARFPRHAVTYCLEREGVALEAIDYVVFYDKPFLKFERLLETYLAFAPHGLRSFAMALPLWIREKLFQKKLLRNALRGFGAGFDFETRLLFAEHHLSHAASAYYPSPFAFHEEAAVLTMDGVGEWATTSAAMGRGSRLEVLREIHFPHSLGLFYSAFTYYAGFRVNSGEYKLMGLAPYGDPKYAGLIRDRLIDIKEDGSFHLDLDYFDYCTGLTMTNLRFDELLGAPRRQPEAKLTQHYADVAASAQAVVNEIVVRLARSLAATGAEALCLAGGVALNCVANAKVLGDGAFRRLWIQPAAGDAGGALGAALAGYYLYAGGAEPAGGPICGLDGMQGALLGPQFEQHDIEQRLGASGARFTVLAEEALLDACAAALDRQQVLGWFQGRMEFGPRALGSRSILADPRAAGMQSALNLKVKFRESFRPFAPAVLREDVSDWFEFEGDSPYMLLVAGVAPRRRRPLTEGEQSLKGFDALRAMRSEVPAVTHVDYSARLQTVHRETNPRFHALLSRFKQRTGCPVLVNTSFNVRGEPIVCTPEDAFRCFMGTDIDLLAIGDCLLLKEEQDPSLKSGYASKVAPD